MFHLEHNNRINKQIYSNCELINDLQFYDGDLDDWIPGTKYAFFIISTVFAKCQKLLKANLKPDKMDVWDYKLQMGANLYDMKLIFLTIDKEEVYDAMQDIIFCTQYSFPWEDQATLFKSVNLYHKLEDFIRINNLKSEIEKIEETESISDDGANINVITFASHIVKSELIEKYREFIGTDYSDEPTYYYFTTAFPWYQQPLLKHFEFPVESVQIDAVFPIVLRRLYDMNTINIIDLIATNLAICDFRNPRHSTQLKDEIDTLIQLSLHEMTVTKSYIQNKIFDLVQYSMDHNVIPIPSCLLYFVYTFQNYFDSVRIEFRNELTARPAILNLSMVDPTIKLMDAFEELSRIRERSNIKFKIDGTGFNRMTISLFLHMMEHDNVVEIILDTNFTWINAIDEALVSKKHQFNESKKVKVKLVGSNPLNFVEEFIGFLKTFKYSNKVRLDMQCPLHSYMIFDNLEVTSLEMYNLHIDHKILDELTRCNLKLKFININQCTLENKIENWELIDGLKQLRIFTIMEDESTWQFMFEYVTNRLIDLKLKEFNFSKPIIIQSDTTSTALNSVQFTLDEYNTKLLLQDLTTQAFFDLYELKYTELFQQTDEVDYDFYH